MSTDISTRMRVFGAGLRAFVVLTVLLGVLYPLAMTGIAQAVFPSQANGSKVHADGREVGSSLLGQSFDLVDASGNPRLFDANGKEVTEKDAADGTKQYFYADGTELTDDQASNVGPLPDPKWFQPRPSTSDYDPTSTGGSNYGPENPAFIQLVESRKAAVAQFDNVPESAVPADAVTASGSALDPDISRAYALIQVDRVAATLHLDPAKVRALVDDHTQGRNLGILGEPRVNVLELNVALDKLAKTGH